MDPTVQSRAKIRSLAVNTLLAAVLAVFVLYFATHNFLNTFRLDDDNLYYLISGLVAHSPDAFKTTFHNLLSCVQINESGDTEASFASRLNLRYNYIWNYTLLSWVWSGIFNLYPHTNTSAVFDGAAFVETFRAGQAIIILAAISLVSFGRNAIERLAIFAVAVIVCAALASSHTAGDRLTVGDPILSMKFVLSAHQNFNIFNFAPRGLSALLLLAACTWRWQKNYRVFYGVLALLGFVHQSNATLIVFTFFGMDALIRPRIFADWPTLLFCVISATCILLREELTQIVGVWLLALVLAVFATLAAASYKLDPFGRLARLLERRGVPFCSTNLADTFIITATWLASMPVLRAVIASGHVDQFAGRYVFWQLHSRYGSLFLAVVVAGAALALYRLVAKHPWSRICAWLMLALAAVFEVAAIPVGEKTPRESEMITDIQAALVDLGQVASNFWTRPLRSFGRDEEQIFYYSQISLLLGRHTIASKPSCVVSPRLTADP
ncbi:hypothetical protein HFO61_33015 [Rhizobium leguminosarum]|uniref:hypothetical protein n=1 Tax=Rhizobium leguminosarum TaxID=384 RepID=UPI001C96C1FB|nr:hypothetical protein [Rhizobium leguminosarum]MBY5551552.1 hypothetical protein [Rhizobium leguminosarum]